MKAVLVTLGILFLFILWPLGLLLLIIGLLIPSDKEIENENELKKLKERIAELEIASGLNKDESAKNNQDEVSLSKEEKLKVEYCEAYLELEEARKKAVVYHQRKELENNLDRLEKELKENNINIDKDNIKEYYENYLSTIMNIEEGLD